MGKPRTRAPNDSIEGRSARAGGFVLQILLQLLELFGDVVLPRGLRIAAQQLLEVDFRVGAVLECVEGLAVFEHRVGHDFRLREILDHLCIGADRVRVLLLGVVDPAAAGSRGIARGS